MSDQDLFERLLAAFYDTMLDETLWPATSALIDEACGLQGNALFVGDGPPAAPRVLFAQLYYRGHSRADLMHEYLEHYHSLDESVPRVRHLPACHLVHISALYTTEELQTSPAYNEMLPRLRAPRQLECPPGRVGGFAYHLGHRRPRRPGRLDNPTTGAAQRAAAPSAANWSGSARRWPVPRRAVRRRPSLLDTSRVGVIHLDRRGRIVEVNDRARSILRHGDGVVDRGGELSARVPADHARLARLVAGALPAAGTAAVSGSMTLRRPAGVARFVVHVLPVGVGQVDFGGQHVAALVLLVEPGRQTRLDPGLVATALDLTPTESQIAVWLAEGQSVGEIAGATGRQASSIRWHLKQIYRKQGLAGQTDLVRLVLSLAALM